MAPKIGWAPQGFLAGNMYYDQEQDYRKSIGQSHQMGDMSIRQREAEYQDYLANAGVRSSERGLKEASNLAKTPIQGALAGADRATAEATSMTAPSNAKAAVFKNEQHKRAVAEDKISSYLTAVLQQHGQNPAAAMTIWRDQIVPQLEREFGEPLPDQFRAMNIDQMATMNNALTQNSETRRAVLLQNVKDTAAGERNDADARSREAVAGIRGNTPTSAQGRAGAYQAEIASFVDTEVKALEDRKKQSRAKETRVTEEEYNAIKRRAIMAANSKFYGGNAGERGGETRSTEAARGDNRLLDLEKLEARGRTVPQDHRQRDVGKLYPNGRGGYGRWSQGGWIPVE